MTGIIDRLIAMDEAAPKHILVIGDPMTDVYIHGRLGECQEGCPKFVEESFVEVPGGACNAARSLASWAARCRVTPDNALGAIKTRLMVEDRCVFRHDDDRCYYDFKEARREALDDLEHGHEEIDAVLISDYDKGLLSPAFIEAVSRACHRRGIPCVADVKRAPSLYPGCILKCNTVYQKVYNRELSLMVYDAENGRSLVVTDGAANPMIRDSGALQKGGASLPSVPCRNHVGAGDCFAAHLTLGLAYGLSLKEAAAVAHSAGRVYVQAVHNQPPTRHAIRTDMKGG